ncbi:MAG TPA: arginyltransferase [Planctomycetota bacterium]|jgi:arginine-tRNA-protein transferase
MLVLHRFTTPPHTCSYLADRLATLEYALALMLSPQEYEDLMNSGHRKFGVAVFKPVCSGCSLCRPIRVPVATFQPDRSQRRNLKRNQDLQVRSADPVCDAQRLALYNRYHAAQARQKGWPDHPTGSEEYETTLVQNPIPSVEISVWEGEVLRGLIINDLTPNSVSAVYHFYDPDCSERGLGTFCILQSIALARKLGKRWLYLGYYVKGCASMEYKLRFRPCEILSEDGAWKLNHEP